MNQENSLWSRRHFLTAIAGSGALLALNPLHSWGFDEVDPRVAEIVSATFGIDTHNHIDVPLLSSELPGPDINISAEMRKSGLSAICATFALDYQKLNKEGESYERLLNGLSSLDSALKKNGMKRALNSEDLQKAFKKRQPIVIQSIEGSHFLEGHIERIKIAYDRGLRHITLLHDSDASVPLGDVYTNQPKFGGLTDFGTSVIKECNRLGILVDLAHASAETVDGALKVAAHPVLISHTGLDTQLGDNPQMARMMKPRLISKERAKIVANAGGVIGVWTHLSDTPLAYAQNIRALVDVVGVDHVCIGTDTKLTPAYRSPGEPGFGQQGPAKPKADNNKQPDGEKPQGNSGNQNKKRNGQGTNESWGADKTGFYYAVVDGLLKTGFNKDEIAKIGGGNFLRIFGAATKGHS